MLKFTNLRIFPLSPSVKKFIDILKKQLKRQVNSNCNMNHIISYHMIDSPDTISNTFLHKKVTEIHKLTL